MITNHATPPARLTTAFIALAAVALTLVAVPSATAGERSALATDLAEARTETAVRVALLHKLGIDALGISISVDGSDVTLTGEVSNRSTQELAKEVALAVDGVKKVHAHVTSRTEAASPDTPVARAVGDAEHEVADAVLESEVKLRLFDTLGLKAFRIEVEATEGAVSLRGTVPSEEHRKIAVKTARETGGVDTLVDLLKVSAK